ncbi:MAG: YciI family protein [Gammaproteobacteria bacterium]|nr:YciI family protein [Gammaproteobacteria bacterium]
MHFALYCVDKPNSLDLRLATRERHLAYIGKPSVKIVLAGPLLSDDGKTMRGSFFIIDADHVDAVAQFSAKDPYRIAGLFERVDIHGFRQSIPAQAP